MSTRFEPQLRASGLIAHPHRTTLRGTPGELDFPPLCPNCGAAASQKIEVTKVFLRPRRDEPTEEIMTAAVVPFCDACARSHHEQRPPLTTTAKVLSSLATGEMLGALFPALAAAFVAWIALKDLFKGRFVSFLALAVLAGFFALIAWSQRRHVWQATEPLRVPKLSDVTQAFDFSDNVADAFEPPRFVCTVRDAGFAAAFQALNRQREWHAASPQARAERRAAHRKMWVVGAVVAALALLALVFDWFD